MIAADAEFPAVVMDTDPASIVETCDDISPERLELARKVFALNTRGLTGEKIATELSISRSTVCRLLSEYKALYAKALSKSPTLHLIAAEIGRIEEIEQTARESAEKTRSERIRQGYLKLALDAIKTKLNLLLDTGVFPREPTKLLTVTTSLDPSGDKEKERPRSDEEIRADILKLLKFSRQTV